MWAMMPIFLIFSIGTVRMKTWLWGVGSGWWENLPPTSYRLPPVMSECFVRLRHSVNVVLFLNGAAAHVGGVGQFVGQLVRHSLVGPGARVLQYPADGQTGSPV